MCCRRKGNDEGFGLLRVRGAVTSCSVCYRQPLRESLTSSATCPLKSQRALPCRFSLIASLPKCWLVGGKLILSAAAPASSRCGCNIRGGRKLDFFYAVCTSNSIDCMGWAQAVRRRTLQEMHERAKTSRPSFHLQTGSIGSTPTSGQICKRRHAFLHVDRGSRLGIRLASLRLYYHPAWILYHEIRQ